MRRMWAAGAAIVMCLALGGMPVVAQSPSSPPNATAWVTGTETCSVTKEGTSSTVDGVEQARGVVASCTATTSDPRVSMTLTSIYNQDCRPGYGCVYWSTGEATGTAGGWVGSNAGIIGPDGEANGLTVWTGTGGYEGMTYLEWAQAGPDFVSTEITGVIYENPPPPWGPMPSPAP